MTLPSTTPVRSRLLSAALLAAAAGLDAQSNWVLETPPAAPGLRSGAAMACDGVDVWLFGGIGLAPLNDTWSWNGGQWTQHQPAASPSARANHAMVFDTLRRRVVLFGGQLATGLGSDETWEWDGAQWTQRLAVPRPSARSRHAMAFDQARSRTVLFGGTAGGAETWEWDGTLWRQLFPASSPAPRISHAMAYQSVPSQVVLFGGSSGGGETWTWDGFDWTQRNPALSPSPRFDHAMAADGRVGRVVVFSGQPALLADTWEWDGVTWNRRQPTTAPTGRAATAMATAPNGVPMLFGGLRPLPLQVFGDLYTLRAQVPTFAEFGAGCGSLVPHLGAGQSPFLGSSWTVRVDNLTVPNAAVLLAFGGSATNWGSTPLPLSLAPQSMPGCNLLVAPELLIFTAAQGPLLMLTMALPSNPVLAGVDVYLQAMVAQPGANPAGAAVTNAGRARLALP